MGAIVNEMSIDVWGCRRNSLNWTYSNPSGPRLFSRGFTGHEHMDAFNLINMNGRVYDPLVGRFLSPDNFVQEPGFSQSYNRYTYCFNNPLAYTDPSGYFGFGPQNLGQIMGPGTPMYNSFVSAAIASYRIGYTTMSVLGMVAGAPAWLSSISSFSYEHSITGEWNYWTLAPAAMAGMGLAVNEIGKALILNSGNFTTRFHILGGIVQLNAERGFEIIGQNASNIINFAGNGIILGDALSGGGPMPTSASSYYMAKAGGDPNALNGPRYRGALLDNSGEAISARRWRNANRGRSREEIIAQRADRSWTFLKSQPGGPEMRYVKDPLSNSIIDMRHMLVIGKKSAFTGNMLEEFQYLTGQASGRNIQDYLSNALGRAFYNSSYWNNIQNGMYDFSTGVLSFLEDKSFMFIRSSF